MRVELLEPFRSEAKRQLAQQIVDERRLTDHMSFAQPSHSTFPNHVDRFDSLQRPPRTLKREEARPSLVCVKTIVGASPDGLNLLPVIVSWLSGEFTMVL